MKKVIYGVFAFAALTLTACGGTENTEEPTIEAEMVEEEVVMAEYNLNTDESKLEWAGSWIGGKNDGKSHNGVINIIDGVMYQEGDKMKGKFAIDMSSIDVQDLDEASGKPKLQGHLASEDFFNINQYALTEVKVLDVMDGNAKIMIVIAGKGMERTVPVSIETDEGTMTMKGDFTLDFAEGDLAGMKVNPKKPEEGKVSSDIAFKLHVVMNKK